MLHALSATKFYRAKDGTRLAWREMGIDRPLILIHGYFSDAQTNWIKYGTAAVLAGAGCRVIMPDLRAHGESDKPHAASAYPIDVLADDAFALIDHLSLTEYDLGGYSLGGRTVARMLVRGAVPERAIIAGMGLEGLINAKGRSAHFQRVFDGLGTHERGSREFMAEAFLKSTGGDPVALAHLLNSFVDCNAAELTALALPIGVICGADDSDNGSASALAALLSDATYTVIPGNHMNCVTKPELGQAILDFIAKGR